MAAGGVVGARYERNHRADDLKAWQPLKAMLPGFFFASRCPTPATHCGDGPEVARVTEMQLRALMLTAFEFFPELSFKATVAIR